MVAVRSCPRRTCDRPRRKRGEVRQASGVASAHVLGRHPVAAIRHPLCDRAMHKSGSGAPTKTRLTLKPATFAPCMSRNSRCPESVVSIANDALAASRRSCSETASLPASTAETPCAAAMESGETTGMRLANQRSAMVVLPAPLGPAITAELRDGLELADGALLVDAHEMLAPVGVAANQHARTLGVAVIDRPAAKWRWAAASPCVAIARSKSDEARKTSAWVAVVACCIVAPSRRDACRYFRTAGRLGVHVVGSGSRRPRDEAKWRFRRITAHRRLFAALLLATNDALNSRSSLAAASP